MFEDDLDPPAELIPLDTPENLDRVVHLIHEWPIEVVLSITGGGSAAIHRLLAAGGGSQTLLAAHVPYCEPALRDLLGHAPDQYCSESTARAMAMAAWTEALALTASSRHEPFLAGVACTASLASDRPKRGPHRIHLAAQTESHTIVRSLELEKGARTRREEEELTANLIIELIAHLCILYAHDFECRPYVTLRDGEETISRDVEAHDDWQRLLAGYVDVIPVHDLPAPDFRPQVVFPGSFNPAHEGHAHIAKIAAERLGHRVAYEISVTNVDKPPLDYFDLHARAAQFPYSEVLYFTRAPRFTDKARLFPSCTFLVGADTIARIADPRYYRDEADYATALESLAAHGARFLVFGRMIDGTFRTGDEVELPPQLQALCEHISAEEFREDVSSTSIRDASSALDQATDATG